MNLLKILLFAIMLSSTLYMNHYFLRVVSAGLVTILLLSFLLNKYDFKFRYSPPVMLIIFLFTFASMLSALFNSDKDLSLGASLLLIIFVAFNITLPSLGGTNSNELVYKSIVYSHIPIVFFPLLRGVGNPPYKGIFDNPNSFGIACVTLLVAVVSKFTHSLYRHIFYGEKIRKRHLLYNFITTSALLMLTIYSGSRTSFITSVAIFIVAGGLLILNFLRKATKKQFIKGVRVIGVGSMITGVAFVAFPIKKKFEEVILYKFQLKSNDTLSERGYVWKSTLEGSGAFGHGRDYFSGFDHAAHNTFISLLGQYGWVPTILFILLTILLLLTSLKYSFKSSNDKYKFLPVLMMTAFISLSTAEGMLFKGTMMAAFASAGAVTVLIKQRNYNPEEIKRPDFKKDKGFKFKKITWN